MIKIKNFNIITEKDSKEKKENNIKKTNISSQKEYLIKLNET